MKKAPFLAVLVLLLGGCTADGDVNDGYEGNNSAAVEEQIGNRENDRLYVNGDGDGYVIYASWDSGMKERISEEYCVQDLCFGVK
ncbi:MAG: hypothetical protein J6Z29_08740 [Ruminococcus sp.]|uniref:hypothetical protein n=1 Tax=uncultured Ruminococcus sp. TaxID=165186 RepID=UPI001B4EA01B|nr:hypothetical protein [uncultured Ruminococcus sp.]MBP5268643.1 hypothetical protein [Ruminococcus sp.]